MKTGLLNVHREWNVVGGGGGSTAITHRMLVLTLVKEDNQFFLRLCEVIVKTDFKKLIIKYQSNSSLRNSLA